MGRKVWVPEVSGPLAPFAAGFASWLTSRAYSPSAAADRLYQFDRLSRWLEREGLGVGELTVEQAERFAAARRAAGLVTWVAPQSAMLPLGYLRALGVAPAPAPVVEQGPLEELLEDYRRYLSIERGLSDHTVLDAYEPAARLFLAGWEAPDGLGLERLCAADVSSFFRGADFAEADRGRNHGSREATLDGSRLRVHRDGTESSASARPAPAWVSRLANSPQTSATGSGSVPERRPRQRRARGRRGAGLGAQSG